MLVIERDIDVMVANVIPMGVTDVSGPSGSGKSILIFDVLAKNKTDQQVNHFIGLEQFDKVLKLNRFNKMKRSNVATYSEAYSEI